MSYFTEVSIVSCHSVQNSNTIQPIIMLTVDSETILYTLVKKTLNSIIGANSYIEDYTPAYSNKLCIYFDDLQNPLLHNINIDQNTQNLDITKQFNENFNDIYSKTFALGAVSELNPNQQSKELS